MSETTNINLRLDKELKAQAEELFAKLGINMTTAFNMFLRQAVREQGIPFKLTAKNDVSEIPPAILAEMRSYPNYDAYVAAKLKEADEEALRDPTRYTLEDLHRLTEEIIDANR
ncbi:MAG: type II toxin-antitoxin system RelB/DinJ family antitoxin [Eubacteriaceae bacterium]|nr:type II toxin-antitoxin system RelB/DinJ family antitoxin [Eubacteriaceae bacterium]